MRYGTKEIIATIVGSALVLFVQWLEIIMIKSGILPEDTWSWVQLRVVVVALVAVFFGPISGVMCGLGGDLLVSAIFESYISYPGVISLGLYGLFIGVYCGKMHFDRKSFTPRDFLDFNAVSIASGIFCVMFFIPLAGFFIEKKNIFDSIATGAKTAAGNSVLTGIICPAVMAAVVAARNMKKKSRAL